MVELFWLLFVVAIVYVNGFAAGTFASFDKLQNQLLKRDLEAIEVSEVKLMPQNDKPKAKSRK